MRPLAATSEAVEEYGPFLEDDDLLAWLTSMGDRVRELVPECVGLSLASRRHGVTFTVIASDEVIASLDGLQYLQGGPCVTAVDEERVVQFSREDILGEEAWQLFARGTAAAAVGSTLTLPVMVDDEMVGSINLYAASPDAFSDKHEAVAAAVGGWAAGAVANADLSFSTRRTAEEAPRLLYEEMRIQVAVGVLVATWQSPVDQARQRLHEAARQAGVTEAAVAELIIKQASVDHPPDGGTSLE